MVEYRAPEGEVLGQYLPQQCCVLEQDTLNLTLCWLTPRISVLCPNITEKLLTAM